MTQELSTLGSVIKTAYEAEADTNALTDAEKTLLGNTSGTNTGDQTNITGNAATVTTNANLTGHVTSTGNAAILGSFTKSQLSTAVSDGTPLYSGDIPNPTEFIAIAASDETTVLTTGTAKATFRMPYAFTLTDVRCSVTTATGAPSPEALLTVDINENTGSPSPDVGTSILSTKLTIDAGERTSTTAATAAVISDSSLADDAEITIDIDVADGTSAGLKVYLIGTRT